MDYIPRLSLSGDYLGHGLDDTGREYEGWLFSEAEGPRYFYTDTGEECADV